MSVADKREAAMVWVKTYLAGAYARCITDLMGCAHFTHEEVLAALRALLAASEIEALVPVGACSGKSRDVAFHPDTHFRVVRRADAAYRWQVRISEGLEANADWLRACVVSTLQERYCDERDWLGLRLPVHA